MNLAQITIAQLEDMKPWFQYGLAGVVIYWLMQKQDAAINELKKAVQDNRDANVAASARIEHRFAGLSRTLLIEMLSREGLHPQTKKHIEVELAKATTAPFQT